MPTVVIGNNAGDDYSGTEDARLYQPWADYNFGANTQIVVSKYGSGNYSNTLLKFSGLSNLSSITVSAATLAVYRSGGEGTAHDITFQRVLRNWVEGAQTSGLNTADSPASCCWNKYGSENSWTSGGGISNGNDRSAVVTGSFSSSDYGYKTISSSQLATDVQNMANGDYDNYGWNLEQTSNIDTGSYSVFDSSEGTDGRRPYLSVTYTESGGSTGHPAASRLRNISRNPYVRYN